MEVVQEKNMSSDSKLDGQASTLLECFGESETSEHVQEKTAVHGIRPYRDDCLAPPCLLLEQDTKTGAQNMLCLHFDSANSRKD